MKLKQVIIALFMLFCSCQKQMVDNPGNHKILNSAVSLNQLSTELIDTTFISNPVNLNIIYFVPNDNPALPNYKKRISDLMIHFQQYVTSEMNRNGFYGKTLGLPLDPTTNRVKIITVQGAHGQSYYDYSSGSSRVWSEIQVYKTSNPTEFTNSVHHFIILPIRSDAGDQPFYGTGRNAYALDFNQLSLEFLSTTTSAYIGGFFHELGHGLNLPHNRQKKGEQSTLGTALMGSGNGTYGKSPTFLSYGDCAILFRNEVFQPSTISNQYASNSTSVVITNASFNTNTQSFTIQGSLSSTLAVNHVLAYFDPISSSGNTDHDSPMWAQSISGNNFSINVSLSDLYSTGSTPYGLNIRLLADNGSLNTHSFSFNFADNIPVFRGSSASFYQHCSYGGYGVSLPFGSYTTAELTTAGILNNDISSIRLPMLGVKVWFYDADNFVGTPLVVNSTNSCLSGIGFNDKVSSIIIEPYGGDGTIKTYKHSSYSGTEVLLGVGAYNTAELNALGILDNDISSIRVPSNMKVTLYDSDYFKGATLTLTADNSYLGGFNDKTSSIIVEQLD